MHSPKKHFLCKQIEEKLAFTKNQQLFPSKRFILGWKIEWGKWGNINLFWKNTNQSLFWCGISLVKKLEYCHKIEALFMFMGNSKVFNFLVPSLFSTFTILTGTLL